MYNVFFLSANIMFLDVVVCSNNWMEIVIF